MVGSVQGGGNFPYNDPVRRLWQAVLAVLGLGLAFGLWGGRAVASSFEPFLLGLDADQIFTERRTATGFASFTICTPFSLTAPSPCGVPYPALGEEPFQVGYLAGQAPLTDFMEIPQNADRSRLWQDGHRAPPDGATLRIANIPPGSYDLILLAHGPGSSLFDETFFWVDGTFVGSVKNDANVPLVVGETQSLVVPIDPSMVADGRLEIRFAGPDPGSGVDGWFNGLVLVPEPGSAILLAAGLALVLGWRRRPSRPCPAGWRNGERRADGTHAPRLS